MLFIPSVKIEYKGSELEVGKIYDLPIRTVKKFVKQSKGKQILPRRPEKLDETPEVKTQEPTIRTRSLLVDDDE